MYILLVKIIYFQGPAYKHKRYVDNFYVFLNFHNYESSIFVFGKLVSSAIYSFISYLLIITSFEITFQSFGAIILKVAWRFKLG